MVKVPQALTSWKKKGGFNPMHVISPVISEKSRKLTEPPNENNSTYLIKFGKLINEEW